MYKKISVLIALIALLGAGHNAEGQIPKGAQPIKAIKQPGFFSKAKTAITKYPEKRRESKALSSQKRAGFFAKTKEKLTPKKYTQYKERKQTRAKEAEKEKQKEAKQFEEAERRQTFESERGKRQQGIATLKKEIEQKEGAITHFESIRAKERAELGPESATTREKYEAKQSRARQAVQQMKEKLPTLKQEYTSWQERNI